MSPGLNPRTTLVFSVLCAAVLLFCINEIKENADAFEVTSAMYDNRSFEGWSSPDFSEIGFKRVNIPLFAGDGYIRLHFNSSKESLRLGLYAQDCVEEAYLDGALVFNLSSNVSDSCSVCRHCKPPLTLELNPGAGGQHVLAVKTRRVQALAMFFYDYERNAFPWRLLALACGALLLLIAYMVAVDRSPLDRLYGLRRWLSDHQDLVAVLVLAALVRVILMPVTASGDLTRYAVVYTESFLHRNDYNFEEIGDEYDFRNLTTLGLMTKPPGWAEYPLGILRTVFGFTNIYYTFLIKLPALFGDMLVAYMIWSWLAERTRDKSAPILAASLYLFNPGVIVVTAMLGKSDSLGVGLLLLALKNIDNRRFSIWYALSLLYKQFPLFLLPWIVIRRRKLREALLAGAILFALMIPYLLGSLPLFTGRMFLAHLNRQPAVEHTLSWISNLWVWGIEPTSAPLLFIAAYAAILVIISYLTDMGGLDTGLVVFALFIVFSPVVFEHYMLWVMPFLIIAYFIRRENFLLITFMVASISCVLTNEKRPWIWNEISNLWNILLALMMVMSAGQVIAKSADRGRVDGLLRRARRVR
jgi:hypothetical protein